MLLFSSHRSLSVTDHLFIFLRGGGRLAEIPDYKQRVHAIKELVRQLPEPNHDTMQALFKHLRKYEENKIYSLFLNMLTWFLGRDISELIELFHIHLKASKYPSIKMYYVVCLACSGWLNTAKRTAWPTRVWPSCSAQRCWSLRWRRGTWQSTWSTRTRLWSSSCWSTTTYSAGRGRQVALAIWRDQNHSLHFGRA